MEKGKKFKCAKELILPKYDEDEVSIDGESIVVPMDSVWEKKDYNSLSEIRLENDDNWIEISFNTLKSNFVEI